MNREENAETTEKIQKLEEHLLCTICQEIYFDVINLIPCKHSFCLVCFAQWTKNFPIKSPTCPECREEVVDWTSDFVLHRFLDENPCFDLRSREEKDTLIAMRSTATENLRSQLARARDNACKLAQFRAVFCRSGCSPPHDDDSDHEQFSNRSSSKRSAIDQGSPFFTPPKRLRQTLLFSSPHKSPPSNAQLLSPAESPPMGIRRSRLDSSPQSLPDSPSLVRSNNCFDLQWSV